MATETALPDVLSSFTTASETALTGLPDVSTLLPPQNGITLLDAKTEIFLSYLQALVLRNLDVIRSIKDGIDTEKAQGLSDELTQKLVEHRVYLERGVRPLEQKFKYELDKVVKAADDDERSVARHSKALNGRTKPTTQDDDSDADSDTSSANEEEDETTHRPNAASFAPPNTASTTSTRRTASNTDGIYRPPRVSATTMPETNPTKQPRRPLRSATVDEYITSELNTAPTAEPSIGSTITDRGRGKKDMRKEAERREYEEMNLVRLPAVGKSEKGGRRGEKGAGFGGEEWRGLGDSVDRIGDLTRRKSGAGKGGVLERSRKRRATEDGPRGDGAGGGMGDAFEVKKRRMDKKNSRR